MIETSIIIPTQEGSKHIQECIQSVLSHTDNYELIFTVNRFSSFCKELRHHGRVLLIDGPFCFSRSINHAARRAQGKYLVILNDDVIVQKDWLSKMILTEQKLGPGIVGARCQPHGCSNQQAHGSGPEIHSDYTINMFAALIPVRVFNVVGPLDERFEFYGGEDCDYTLRAFRHGMKVLISDAEVFHIKSQSFGPQRIQEELPKTREIFRAKWGERMPIPPFETWRDSIRLPLLQPLISVLMATRNHEDYIAECIQSILDQTHSRFELLIGIDGGGQEKTRNVVEKFTDPRISLFESPKRLGSCGMRNRLFQRSGAEFIALMDSDDQMLPDRLERQLEAMEPSTDVLHAAYLLERQGLRLRSSCQPINLPLLLSLKHFPAGGTFLMRRHVLEKEKFDEHFSHAFDFEFVLRCFHLFKFKFLDIPSIVYRRHSGEHLSGNEKSIQMHKQLVRRYSCVIDH